MDLLGLIWSVAFCLALGAVAWMMVLVMLRVVHDARAGRRAADRAKVEAALVRTMTGRCDLARELGPYCHRARLMAESLLEILAIVRGPDREAILAGCRTLGVDARLRARLFRGSLAGRLASAEALAAFPGPDTDSALMRALAVGSPRMRLALLDSIVATKGAMPLHLALVRVGAGGLQRSALGAQFLHQAVAADPVAAIALLEAGEAEPSVAATLLEGLGGAGDYRALPVLVAHAESPLADIRAAAVRALGQLMHPAAQAALARAVADEAWEVRSAAALAIGGARLSALAASLAERLDDPVWNVRFEAAASLARLGGAGREHLAAAAEGPLSAARSAATLALAVGAAA